MSDKQLPVFDGHNDTLLNLYIPERGGGRSFFDSGQPENGHIDLPRAKTAGLSGGFFAIFVPSQAEANEFSSSATADGYDFPMPAPLEHAPAMQTAISMMAILFELERQSEGQFKVTRTVDEIEDNISKDVMSGILHFEGAEAIDTDLNALEVFYQAGLRSLGLVWSRKNDFAQGVPLKYPATPDFGDGLTSAGKALVRACNEMGIMIDLSHLNTAGFWDVAKISDAPLVATHSNVHAICHHARNLVDKQLDAIKETEGMVGINFGVGFLREDGRWERDTPLEIIVEHINYLVERIGIDCVGFGSDFDGVRTPYALADITGLPDLIRALETAGYNQEELAKILYKNWLRVLRLTWK